MKNKKKRKERKSSVTASASSDMRKTGMNSGSQSDMNVDKF
ncbi:MAG: hypothetical protein ACOYJD_08365 [Christensenellales bacterium]|jgi:hypothetical protein